MIFIDSSYNDFLRGISDKNVIIFGASSQWDYYLKIFPNFVSDVISKTLFIVDNDSSKWGVWSRIGEQTVEIRKTDDLLEQDNYIVLIAASVVYQLAICEQLLGMPIGRDIKCYSLPLMVYGRDRVDNSCIAPYFAVHTCERISAKIHSFWFSGEEKPDIYKKCIESWYKYCPDYDIIEWNADNYDIAKNHYMEQAYIQKKWAFVSDYARLDVIHEYGGIYLDMDVELTASIDWLRNAKAFFSDRAMVL